jgi:hypothetical protein
MRERAATIVQNYAFSQSAVDRYKNQMIPRARKAYEMYTKKYQHMAAAYPQVLIAQRTLMQLEVSYVNALESFATSSLSLQSYLLTDGLEAPAQPGGIDQPVREVNLPMQLGASPPIERPHEKANSSSIDNCCWHRGSRRIRVDDHPARLQCP